MSEIKVSTLAGPQLDYWVAKAEGKEVLIAGGMAQILYRVEQGVECYQVYSPSTDWSQGGPIIERERYSFATIGTGMPDENGNKPIVCIGRESKATEGKTHLVAAMRCYVTSKFGEEVDE